MKKLFLSAAAAAALLASPAVSFAQSGTQGQGGGPAGTPPAASSPAPNGTQERNELQRNKPQREDQMKPGTTGGSAQMHEQRQEQRKSGAAEERMEQRRGTGAAEERSERHRTGTTTEQRTERRGSTGKHVDVSTEQRTVIHRTIVEQKVKPVERVNFSVNVGTRVPRTVHLYPLPPRVVEVVPAYRGYEYFLLPSKEIVIVEPQTLEIVAVIPA